MLNEDFDVDKSLAYEYVWATIDTKQEQLMIYYREKNADATGLVKIYEYKTGENVKRFKEKFRTRKVYAMLWTLPPKNPLEHYHQHPNPQKDKHPSASLWNCFESKRLGIAVESEYRSHIIIVRQNSAVM